MWCYFLSKRLCALKINGEFAGYVGDNLCKTQIENYFKRGDDGKFESDFENCFADKPFNEKTFFEFIPTSGGYQTVSFCCDLKNADKKSAIFLKNQSDFNKSNVRIIDLYGDFLLLPKFFRSDCAFSADLKTQKLGDGISATLFCFNGLCLFLEANGKSEFFSLGSDFFSVEFKLSESGFLLVTAKNENKKRYFLFTVTETPALVLIRDGDECFFEKNALTVIKKNLGVCRIERRENFDLEKPENSYRSFIRGVSIFSLNEKLLPYAFLEEVFLGANFEDYLSRDLKENKKFIPEFIGDFEFFLPPIKRGGGIVLIKKDKQKAEFLSLTIKNGCVVDINFL